MRIEITKQFIKAASKLSSPTQKQVAEAIDNFKKASSLSEINHLKPLYSKKNRTYYRIRVGEYRIGLQLIEGIYYFQTIDIRGDFYKTYPPK